MDEVIEMSFAECVLAIQISFIKNHPRLSASEIGKEIGQGYSSPIFQSTMNKLKVMDCITLKEKIGTLKILQINHKKLKKLLWDVPKIAIFRDYFEHHHLLFYS